MPESAKEGARPLAESSDIGLGSRDRAFESPHSDQNPSEIVDFSYSLSIATQDLSAFINSMSYCNFHQIVL